MSKNIDYSSIFGIPAENISDFAKHVYNYYNQNDKFRKKLDVSINRKVCELLAIALDPSSSDSLTLYTYFLKKYNVPATKVMYNRFNLSSFVGPSYNPSLRHNYSNTIKKDEIIIEIALDAFLNLKKLDSKHELEYNSLIKTYEIFLSSYGNSRDWKKITDYSLWKPSFGWGGPALVDSKKEFLDKESKVGLAFTYNLLCDKKLEKEEVIKFFS